MTGSAGFVGSHLITALHVKGHEVVGVDNLKASYGDSLPQLRLLRLSTEYPEISMVEGDLTDTQCQAALIERGPFDCVFHLAAWPGVRRGEEVPEDYIRSNLAGLSSVISLDKLLGRPLWIFASSSSVYGNLGNARPCLESDASPGTQLSLYARTKWIGEQIFSAFTAHSPARAVAARFFTVIGPQGRPDMAYAQFARRMVLGDRLPIYGDGSIIRDFSDIKDVTKALVGISELNHDFSSGEFLPINIGFGQPRSVLDLVHAVSNVLNIEPNIEFCAQPKVDSTGTHADCGLLTSLVGSWPTVSLEESVESALKDHSWIWK